MYCLIVLYFQWSEMVKFPQPYHTYLVAVLMCNSAVVLFSVAVKARNIHERELHVEERAMKQ